MDVDRFSALKANEIIDLGIEGVSSVEKRLVHGDVGGHIILELSLDDDHLNRFDNQLLLRGARVFYTDNGLPLVIHSEESLKLVEKLKTETSQ